MRASFGKLHDTLELQEGMNLLYMPNEAGKSTWSAFLLAMLYGIDTSERAAASNQGLPAKERYRPWDGSPMEGAVELEWNGRNITIERRTERRTPMGAFRAYETESGTPLPELTGENCGRLLCGVERSVFERTAFIRQLGMPVSADAALEKRLGALVTTGEDGAKSFTELSKALRDLKNQLCGRAGSIPRLTSQIHALEQELSRLQSMQEEAAQILTQKEACAQELSRLTALTQRIERAQQAKQRAGLNELEQKLHEQELLCSRLKQTAATLPEDAKLRSLQQALDAAEKALETAQMEAAFSPSAPAAPAVPPYFSGMDAEEAKEKAARDCAEYQALCSAQPPKYTKRRILSSLPSFPGVALLLFGLLPAGATLRLPAIIVGGILIVFSLLLLFFTHNAERNAREAVHQGYLQAERIPLRYGQEQCDALPALAQRYADDCAAYQALCEGYAAKKRALDVAVTSAQAELQQLIAAVATFAPGCNTAAQCREALHAALGVLARSESEERVLDGMLRQQASLQKLFGSQPQQPEDTEALELDAPRIAYERHNAEEQLVKLTSRLAELRGAMHAKGNPNASESELAQARKELAEAQERSAVIDLTLAALTQADTELRSRFSPQITALAGKLLAYLTGGKYPHVLLEPNLRLSVREKDGTLMRPAAAMSCGTADQMYLALRLAMARQLLPESTPLVLDDALVNFDTVRAHAALSLLKEEANHRQVILFTCREFGDM